jgi:diguanylate cyclase (GGDEF)-like protein
LLIPVPPQRALLFAERIAVDPEISRIIDRLHRQVKLFRIESEQAKKIALAKYAETEAVIAQAEEVSHMDELTLLPNRRGILIDLQEEVIRAQRYNTPLSVSMLDLDHFKRINDSYGHGVGDKVLRQVAIILREHVREPDRVARYGGEEFLIVLPNSALEAASEQAARLCRQVRESVIQVNDNSISVSISIGVAEFQNEMESWQMLLERADAAMYEAKNAGRDGWAASRP